MRKAENLQKTLCFVLQVTLKNKTIKFTILIIINDEFGENFISTKFMTVGKILKMKRRHHRTDISIDLNQNLR